MNSIKKGGGKSTRKKVSQQKITKTYKKVKSLKGIKTKRRIKTANALKSFLEPRRKKQTAIAKEKRQITLAKKRVIQNQSENIELPDETPEATGIAYKNLIRIQQKITELALIDAKHDFPELAEEYKKNIAKYLPQDYSKDKIIDQIQGFQKITGLPLFETIYNAINTNEPLVLNIADTKREYLIYGKNISELHNGYDILDMLRKGSNTNNNQFTFFVDTYSHHLLEKIRQLSQNKEQIQKYNQPNIFLAYNREVICDPGTKTTNKTKPHIFKELQNSVALTQLDDTEPSNIEYSNFDGKNKSILNDFYSNFDIVLGNPKNLFYKLVDKSSNEPVEYFSNIEENENSVSLTTQRIITSKGVDSIVPFFQKRSGDWLQALSSLQKFRDYRPTTIKGIPILVTIDQPFLAYALKVGVNVLFCQGENTSNNIEKSFIFFYNNSATRKENPLESFKLFFNNPQRYIDAINSKNKLLSYFETLNGKIIEYLDKLLKKMNDVKNLIIEKDIKIFNDLYITYHLLIISRILLIKNFKQFIEEPYKSFAVENINVELNTEENILNLYKKEQFVIQVETYSNKYSEEYIKSELNKYEKIYNDYRKCVKLDQFVFLDFGRLFSEYHLSSETLMINKTSIKSYYAYLSKEEPKYLKSLLEIISYPKFLRSKYINLFKELNIFQYLTSLQEGGANKIEKNSGRSQVNQRRMQEVNNNFTLSLSEAMEENTSNSAKTASLTTHLIGEKEEAIMSITYLENILKDYNIYERTNVVKFYDNNKMYLSVDLSLQNYHFKVLQNYLEANKDKDIYHRFIDCILEVLYRNNIHTFNKSEVKKVFAHMKESNTIIQYISKIKDFETQDSCLAVARQLFTEKTYATLMADFPINF